MNFKGYDSEDRGIKFILKHEGCDRCIFECKDPTLLYVKGVKLKGHKACMAKELNERLKAK